MKDFIKNNAFKCVVVLLSIALVCSGLLAVLSNVLAVSDEERTSRAIQKIYGQVVENYDEVEIDSLIDVSDYGAIDKLYRIDYDDSFDLLFKATGKNGYKNGTITLWVQVNVKDNKAKIVKTILESYEKQTLMSKFGSSFYDSYKEIEYYTAYDVVDVTVPIGKVETGATYSSNANNNAVNCVVKYVKEALAK